MTLPERMVEAAARALADLSDPSWADAGRYVRDEWMNSARAALTAALTVAEEAGAVLCKVPDPEQHERGMDESSCGVVVGFNACRAATLAERVTL